MLKKRRRQLYIALVCLAAVISLLPRSARAIGRIDTDQPVSLTVRCQKEQAVSGVRFSLYQVADVSGTAAFRLTGDFAGYPVSLDDLSSADWQALAGTLAAYAARDHLAPLDSGRTGSDGTLRFPQQQKSLLPGLYLVVGDSYTAGNRIYTPSPFLICLPNLDSETDMWVYDETVDPKYTWETGDGGDEGGGTVRRKVLKVWEDDGAEDERPESVTVQLLRNGKVYDTVTLSGKNRWSYEWSGLEQGDIWQVVEADVPEEYTVTVSREGVTFVVTNTLTEEITDEPTPEGPLPEVPEENIPDEPVPQGPALPQTGVLWWPVPLLACAGMALFLAGWARRRSEECDEA